MKKTTLSLVLLLAACSNAGAQQTDTLKSGMADIQQRLDVVKNRYAIPVAPGGNTNPQKPTAIKSRLIAVKGSLDSIRYYYGTYRGSNFPTVTDNIYTYFAPLHNPWSLTKNIPYDSAAKWHRNYSPPDTILHKQRTYVNTYDANSHVTAIHNPSNMQNEMGNAPTSRGEKYLNITYNANGMPTQYEYYYDTTWNLDPIYYYYGNEQYLFYGKHLITWNAANKPLTDIFKRKDADSFHNDVRITYFYDTNNNTDSIQIAKWDTIPFSDPVEIDWIDTGKSYFTNGPNGNYLMETWAYGINGWSRVDLLKEEHDTDHREINRELSVYNQQHGTYYTDSREIKSYTGASLLPVMDSTYFGYQAYSQYSSGYSSILFTGPSVWVPNRYRQYYTGSAGTVDSFYESQNYSAINGTFNTGWVPVARVLLAYNSDALVTNYHIFNNWDQSVTWHDNGDNMHYYYETYEDTPPPPPMGIQDVKNTNNAFFAYPNPASGAVYIKFITTITGTTTFTLADAMGRVILHDKLPANGKINTTNLQDGIYLLSVYNDKSAPLGSTKLILKH